jgi:hypothetical protein
MATKSKRLTLLSDAEQFALYGLPDFDDGQQLEYLSLSEAELALACSRPGLHAQVYCVLQIGCFKAKRAFFHFAWSDVEDDCAFVLTRHFIGQAFEPHPITSPAFNSLALFSGGLDSLIGAIDTLEQGDTPLR